MHNQVNVINGQRDHLMFENETHTFLKVFKKVINEWKAGLLWSFWTVWKARNVIVFRDDVLSIQRLNSFLYISIGQDQIVFYGWFYNPCVFH